MHKKFWKCHKLAHNLMSQTSLEFLVTYAWAFIAISIAIGALFYFGILDFSKYLPQKCIFPSQFKCLDFSLQPTEVRIKLVNNIGENVRVTSTQITNDATPPISCTAPAAFDWADAEEKDMSFTDCTEGGYIAGERVELKVSMSYFAINTPSQPIHSINGKVNGRVG